MRVRIAGVTLFVLAGAVSSGALTTHVGSAQTVQFPQGVHARDRVAQVRQTLKAYWYDITHSKWKAAYAILSPGTRASISLADYSRNWKAFLAGVGRLTVTVGKPRVKGASATVPVIVRGSFAPGHDLHVYQHLNWSHARWYITDQNGALSSIP